LAEYPESLEYLEMETVVLFACHKRLLKKFAGKMKQRFLTTPIPCKQWKCNFRLLVLEIVLAFVFMACATQPPPKSFDEQARELVAVLPAGADSYALFSPSLALPFLEESGALPVQFLNFLATEQSRALVDKTTLVAGAFWEDGRWYVAARGNYPVGEMNTAFTFSADWKRARQALPPKQYWRNEKAGLLAAVEKTRLTVSNGVLAEGPGLSETPPGGPGVFVLSLWSTAAVAVLDAAVKEAGVPMRMPVRRMCLHLRKTGAAGKPYQALVVMESANPREAKAFFAMTKIVRGKLDGNNLIFNAPSSRVNNSVLFELAPMDQSEVSLLFSRFSL
jgi:hypothetical protein